MNKEVIKIRDKYGRVLLKSFLLALLRAQRSYKNTHPLHKHEQLCTFPVLRFSRNEYFDQNILYCRLLSLITYQLSLFLTTCHTVDVLKSLPFAKTISITP